MSATSIELIQRLVALIAVATISGCANHTAPASTEASSAADKSVSLEERSITMPEFRRAFDAGAKDEHAHKQLTLDSTEVSLGDVTLQLRLITNLRFAYELGYLMAQLGRSEADAAEVIANKYASWKSAIGLGVRVVRGTANTEGGAVVVSVATGGARSIDVGVSRDIVADEETLSLEPAESLDRNGSAPVKLSYGTESREISLRAAR